MPIRILLAVASSIAAIFVAREASNFAVVQGMVAVGLIALVVLVLALFSRK
ncbi:hypothetical protein [Roseomonas xinghualingensis]|uniref:hypothetical protein n=1 Tax=Roseomonas xinghualingensis TaxID=2986475 RepID=UPI0021F1BE57|nr:hypothetical protein [Roseomonas sp. SXEYE001]MCV4207935.1 hypothetical protein [Roseomonas sp. SXEYE001]